MPVASQRGNGPFGLSLLQCKHSRRRGCCDFEDFAVLGPLNWETCHLPFGSGALTSGPNDGRVEGPVPVLNPFFLNFSTLNAHGKTVDEYNYQVSLQ